MDREYFLKSFLPIELTSSRMTDWNAFADRKMAAKLSGNEPDFAKIREDFPRVRSGTAFFNCAATHPINVHTASVLHRYTEWATNDVGSASYGSTGYPAWAVPRNECKRMFAELIGANESEISFARSTVEAENNILNGMDIKSVGGNVVTSDLHYAPSVYNYKMRERDGLDVRIVRHRDWRVDIEDLKKHVDHNTKLIALTFVSNVNGYHLHDIKAISDLAHEHGAYLYADIIQAAGAVPIDVKAMGIDMAACSNFKFLMGGTKGFAFQYVREDLRGTVVRPTQHTSGVRYNYAPWVDSPDVNAEEILFTPQTDSRQYEAGIFQSWFGLFSAIESLRYIHKIGVENIRNHVRPLTDRLAEELPSLGYPSITPPGNESPIISFACEDPVATIHKLREAGVHVAMRFGNKMRVSVSVYNNQEDISRLIEALS